MNNPENSSYQEEWKKIARKDWRRIKILLKEDDAEAAGIFLQQALEKYLKAFLLQKGWHLRKIHDLETLLDEVVKYIPKLEVHRELCEKISGYYFIERYPSLGVSELTRSEIEEDTKKAKSLIRALFKDEIL